MNQTTDKYFEKDFWIKENRLYAEPNFRLRKCATIINQLAEDRDCDLLDVGCGPAALRQLLNQNIHYYGIDIALHESASYLLETDFGRSPIDFGGRTFDFVVALGVFEYMGDRQAEKFREIRRLLKPCGKFLMSYINFGHFRRRIFPIYNNIQSYDEMKADIEHVFRIDQTFPVSHHWRHKQPGKNALPNLQLRMHRNIPLVSSWLAVEYFFICSLPASLRSITN